MNSFRNNFYDGWKDRRYGLFFLICFFISVGILLPVLRDLSEESRRAMMSFALPGLGLLALAMVLFFWRCFRSREASGRCGKLSSDERRVARSKLRSGFSGFKSVRPGPRPVDTDLRM